MKLHANAPHGPKGRAEMVRRVLQGQVAREVAEDFGVSERTVRKWLGRYRAEGKKGLEDRSCRPHVMPTATPDEVRTRIETLRRQRWTGARIAAKVSLSPATVHRILKRLGLDRLRKLDPKPPVHRYQWATPGEMLHVDIKKLGRIVHPGHRITGDRRDTVRGAGWEWAHVCVDDASRLAYVEILPDERAPNAVGFLRRAASWLGRLGIRPQRVMTDNGPAYLSRDFAASCAILGTKHVRTRPYTPRTNGKAERFIQTLLREWAYPRVYRTSSERRAWLPRWLHVYNFHRPHQSLDGVAPITRVASGNNLVRAHS
jgi:transposase InsO family protein